MAAVWFGVCSRSAVSQEGILGFGGFKSAWGERKSGGREVGFVGGSPGVIQWDLG